MKKLYSLAALLIFCISAVSAQQAKSKIDPVGKWKFEAPYAPEGFTTGTVDVGFAEGKHSAMMTFTSGGYSLNGEKVTVRNDSLFFLIWVESTDVNVALKIENKAKMTGKAVYFEGSVPLELTKETEQE